MSSNVTPEDFRNYLRELQKNPYTWPNDYFAWEKPDKTLFMVGIASTQMYQLLIHEINKDSFQNKTRISFGEPPEYSSILYGISPNISYAQANLDGPTVPYDPVEKLAAKISEYKFLGTWRDPDLLMESRNLYSKVLACGRWDLAKEHILQPEKKPSLSNQISQAQEKSANAAENVPEALIRNHPSNSKEFGTRG